MRMKATWAGILSRIAILFLFMATSLIFSGCETESKKNDTTSSTSATTTTNRTSGKAANKQKRKGSIRGLNNNEESTGARDLGNGG